MTAELSAAAARKLLLHSQRLHSKRRFGSGVDATLDAIEHLGYVQIDTLSVVARAHLHTLWNRLTGFSPTHIDQLQRDGRVFEYWSHALAILPMKDFRYALPMMNRIANGDVHWYPKDTRQTRTALERIKAEGPLSSKDFDSSKSSKSMWSRSPSKIALEQLFMEGKLMISHRVNFHKFYDLRERVLPSEIDTSVPGTEELCRFLIRSFLRCHGLAQVREMAYLRKGLGPSMQRVAREMAEDKEIVPVRVGQRDYYSQAHSLELLSSRLPRSSFRILSPFDNAIIQRKRVGDLFDFDYQIECYVKRDKRKYGYFCLPLLHRNRLVGRLDAKADRKCGILHLLHLQLEESVSNKPAVFDALGPELRRFAKFNGCGELRLHRLTGSSITPEWLR